MTTLLKTHQTTFDGFCSLIGKLQHAVKGIPVAGFWLARMREYQTFLERSFQQKQANKRKIDEVDEDTPHGRRSHRDTPPPFYRYTVPESIIPDLEMWVHLLAHAHDGISLNRLVCGVPTHLFHTDSCPEGMGGYSVRSGRAWRCQINKTQLDRLRNMTNCNPKRSNNVFEFVAIVVSVWVDCWNQEIHPDDAVLALTDNSSAVGWMYRTYFGSDKPLHVTVAEQVTQLVLNHKFALQTEHIPGKQNDVSDLLSRAWHLDDNKLTSFLHEHFSPQIPTNFYIKPLPSDILCWISSIVPVCHESSMERQKVPTRSATNAGNDGQATSPRSDSATTPSLTPSQLPTTRSPSHVPSYNVSAMPTSRKTATARTLFKQALLRKPLETWHRGSGITTFATAKPN